MQLYSIMIVGIFAFVHFRDRLVHPESDSRHSRVSEEAEISGLDTTELGMEAYPEFSKG